MRAVWHAVVSLALGAGAHAAALRAEFSPLAPRPRSHAPALVDVKLHFQGAGVLEGTLDITLESSAGPVVRQRTQELALINGAQAFRVFLPSQPAIDTDPATEAHLTFLPKKGGVIDLGRYPYANPQYGVQNLTIASSGARRNANDSRPRLWNVLRPENFEVVQSQEPIQLLDRIPNGLVFRTSPSLALRFATSPTMFEPADFPATPLALCAFDLVLLEGDSFAQLREKQLTALAAWLEGGGSLCIAGAGSIGDAHLRFLNQLTAPERAPIFSLDENSQLVSAAGPIVSRIAELGRILVAKSAPETAADAAAGEWTQAAAFLWRRNLRKPAEKDHGANLVPPSASLERQRAVAATKTGARKIAGRSSAQTNRENIQQIVNELMPRSTRLIPLPVVGAILGAFLIVVGPGDWFVLGWLRRRRWTWVIFPIVAVAFTSLTVLAAERYLGAVDHRAAIVITDVGRGGRALRESRLELLFAARDREESTQLRQSLAVPTNFGTRQYSFGRTGDGAPVYEGQFPARATLRQHLRQWTPQVNRRLTFEPTARSGIRWDAVTAPELATQENPGHWFATRAAPDFSVMVLHQSQQKNPTIPRSPDFHFLSALSVVSDTGEQNSADALLAPSGEAGLRDLAVVTADDPDAWVVIAIKRTPTEIQIFRRVYRTTDE